MDLKKIIKHHRDEAEHTRRLHAHVAAEFHTKAAQVLEDVERRFAEAIIESETRTNCRLAYFRLEASEWVLT